MIMLIITVGDVCSKNAYGNMPLGAIPLPETKPTVLTLPKTRGKSVKELTGDYIN